MKKLFFLISVAFFIGCESVNEPTIKIDNKNAVNYQIKIKKVVPLETNDHLLIGDLAKLIYYKNNIYTFDILGSKTITCFDSLGQFKYSLRHGKGPGEILLVSDFCLKDSSLLVRDGLFVREYNSSTGEYISDMNFEETFFFHRFLIDKHENFVTYGYSPPMKDIKSGKYTDEGFKERMYLYKILNRSMDDDSVSLLKGNFEYSSYTPFQPFCNGADGSVFSLYPPYGEIHRYDSTGMNLYYKIDFGKNAFSPDQLAKGIDYYLKQINSKRKYGCVDHINDTKDFLTFTFLGDGKIFNCCVFSKENKEAFLLQSLLESNNLPDFSILSVHNNTFVCVLYPVKCSRQELNSIKERFNIKTDLNQNSNPVIFFAEIESKN